MGHPPLAVTLLVWTVCAVLIQLIFLWTPLVCCRSYGVLSKIKPDGLRKLCCVLMAAGLPLLVLIGFAREIAKAVVEVGSCIGGVPGDIALAWKGRS